MEIPKGYKQSKIGILPEDWDIKTISQITTVVTGATPSTDVKEYWGGNIPWMASGELNLKIVKSVQGRITKAGYNSASTHMIPPYCVLIGLAGQGKTRGTAAYNIIPLCTNQSIASILPQNDFCSKYLYYYLDSQYEYLRALSSGDGGRGGLNLKLINNITIPFPPIEEQKRIAAALTDVDELIAALNQKIEKKRQIKEGAMQQLLTGKTRLPGFTEPWRDVQVGKIGYTYSGITGKSKKDFGQGDAQYITFLNVLNNPVINTAIFERVNISPNEGQNAVQKDDLFFNTSSETPEEVGICSVLNEDIADLYLNSFCFGYRLTDTNVFGHYLAYFWRSKQGRYTMTKLAQGATRYNLSKAYFNRVIITVPQTKKEQIAIVEVLSDMDEEIRQLEEKRDKYTLVKQGMMQELLTGKIRLN